MLAIDTNVVVRFLTGDHPQQSVASRKLIEHEKVWISTTVLLETGWVLKGAYGFDTLTIIQALRKFAGLANVSLENPAVAAQALGLSVSGMDYADAFHLAAASLTCETMISFDASLRKTAKRLGALSVRAPS
ncbi:type II toxin-antitoxin system VapC family toxin [Phyllobacterium zundukense]|jgi:predicted nucleic-acid-binding protein|uniref:Type II toxin-antitoxin system VapC family toxin n=1 Tax=Phyllobacterium zundukense TaxID=1867719 RepID=A0ACD4D9D5_9HYPH|nr:type II toxin-antitoxin system VapC family toxin [Phyllobacterium zundukense]UXN62471.1 type II toxin-antitoxin system VapC family toxin [Phyllobacterium zundukense]